MGPDACCTDLSCARTAAPQGRLVLRLTAGRRLGGLADFLGSRRSLGRRTDAVMI